MKSLILSLAALALSAGSPAHAEQITVKFDLIGTATHNVFRYLGGADLDPADPDATLYIRGQFTFDADYVRSHTLWWDSRLGIAKAAVDNFTVKVGGEDKQLFYMVAYDPRQLAGEGLSVCLWTSAAYEQCGFSADGKEAALAFYEHPSAHPFATPNWGLSTEAGGDIYSGSFPEDGSFNYSFSRPFVLSPAPEPSTWAALVCGFACIGWKMRRRGILVRQ